MKLSQILTLCVASIALVACDQNDKPNEATNPQTQSEQASLSSSNATTSLEVASSSTATASQEATASVTTPEKNLNPQQEPKHAATAENPIAIPQNFHYQDTVVGADFKTYTFKAEKGQKLLVKLTTQDNVDAFLYGYDDFSAGEPFVLPETQEYEVRVGMTRNSARKGEKATFEIDITVSN